LVLYEGGNRDARFSGEVQFFLDFLIVGLSPEEGLVMSGWRPLIKGFFAAMRLIVGAVMSSACRCGF
jgi:hypothetical protein